MASASREGLSCHAVSGARACASCGTDSLAGNGGYGWGSQFSASRRRSSSQESASCFGEDGDVQRVSPFPNYGSIIHIERTTPHRSISGPTPRCVVFVARVRPSALRNLVSRGNAFLCRSIYGLTTPSTCFMIVTTTAGKLQDMHH